MRNFMALATLMALSACYSIPTIKGFNKSEWSAKLSSCSENRLDQAQVLLDNQKLLLGEGQAEIKSLLGQPTEHELYNRNQKFFYYNLTLPECVPAYRLSVRFDALDRVKEVLIVEN